VAVDVTSSDTEGVGTGASSVALGEATGVDDAVPDDAGVGDTAVEAVVTLDGSSADGVRVSTSQIASANTATAAAPTAAGLKARQSMGCDSTRGTFVRSGNGGSPVS